MAIKRRIGLIPIKIIAEILLFLHDLSKRFFAFQHWEVDIAYDRASDTSALSDLIIENHYNYSGTNSYCHRASNMRVPDWNFLHLCDFAHGQGKSKTWSMSTFAHKRYQSGRCCLIKECLIRNNFIYRFSWLLPPALRLKPFRVSNKAYIARLFKCTDSHNLR